MVMWSLFFSLLLMSGACSRHSDADNLSALQREVKAMRQCQRKADNLNFYLHKNNAEKLIERYSSRQNSLSEAEQHQFLLSRGYYNIIYSDYLLQIGNRREAVRVVDRLAQDKTLNLNVDTMLWLNYLVHQGQAGYHPYGIRKNRKSIEQGYDCLMQCYILASRNGVDKYKAISMQWLSQYLLIDSIMGVVREFDPASLRYINEDGVADSLLAGNLAERALGIFLKQKDFYYTANAWRNLATCYFYIGDAETSLQCLNNALANPAIDSMPDVKASLSEQMSMSYAALDDKQMSYHYRNQYLDLQDSTRQDRQYEARIITLENTTHRIWMLVALAFAVFLLLCIIAVVLVRLRHRKSAKEGEKNDLDTLRDQLSILRLQYSDAQRAMVEQRARVSIVSGMLSLIERLRHAVSRKDNDYAREITRDIEQQNAMLTQWIKLNQGKISPKIETFPISDILSIVEQSRQNLAAQGITLAIVSPCVSEGIKSTLVRADKSLTLFIINTLIDNARKAISGKGRITITLTPQPVTGRGATLARQDCLSIAIADTGKGMTATQLEHLFEVKPLKDEAQEGRGGYGFGLQNCRGIIDRYRKISSIFSVCHIDAQSEVGKGTTITFTLPAVLKMLIMLLVMSVSQSAFAKPADDIERYADSLYQCNVEGRFREASLYADTCKTFTHNSLDVPEDKQVTFLSIYNETAVAALALHQWHRYQYYNYLYTQLYKQATADKTLPDYSKKKEQGELIANIAMVVVLLLIASLLPLMWFTYLRPLLRQRREARRQQTLLEEEIVKAQIAYDRIHVQNNIVSNQLSTIKHETMYYPTRIRQLLDAGDSQFLHSSSSGAERNQEVDDTVAYYAKLYTLLSRQMVGGEAQQSHFSVKKIDLSTLTSHPLVPSTLSPCPSHLSVLANEELLTYLQLLLKRHNSGTAPEVRVVEDSAPNPRYVTLAFIMHQSDITPESLLTLFTPNTPHTDYLVMRQIVREIADATLAYGAGIHATLTDRLPTILVTLPRAL